MMAEQKDTDLHRPDGIIFEGDKVGHADKKSRIRRRDGLIFRGEEMGYVDRQKNIRLRDGIIFKGEIVGQVKGASAHAQDGIIFAGEEWGYVDGDGNIRQRDGIIFRGRIIGKMRGHNKEAALGFYVLRFNDLVDRYERLEQEARQSENKGKYIGKVRHMLSYVPHYDALGDFDNLIDRLKRLEDDLVNEIERHRRSRIGAKEALIREAERLSYSSDWKAAASEIRTLQARWKGIGGTGEQEETLWQRFRAACDRFFERRTRQFEALDRERAHNAAQKEQLCSTAESLQHSADLKAATSRVKDLQHQWKTIGPARKEVDDRLWNRFRHACDEVFAEAKKEWERKQREWRDKMHDTLRAKREQANRLRESIAHDESNISRWRDTIYNLRPGRRADEIRESLEAKISDVQDRMSSKERKLSDIEDDIADIERKLCQ